MIDPAAVTAAAAAIVAADPADPRWDVISPAAIRYCALWCDTAEADLPDAATDPLVFRGVTLLAARVWHDNGVPSGQLAALDSFTLTGAAIPEDLSRHLADYWRHVQMSWGIA